VSSLRTARSRSRNTRVRQSWNILLRRVSRGARLVRRTLTAAPLMVRIVCLTALVLAAFSLTNLVYHVVRKPSELLFFVGGALDKEPVETWRRYEPLFHTYSTSTIAPEHCIRGNAVVDTGCGARKLQVQRPGRFAILIAVLDRLRPRSWAKGLRLVCTSQR
jgi:hypothetical protein